MKAQPEKRTLVSKSEFEADPLKKGWNKEELAQLVRLTDRCVAGSFQIKTDSF